MSCDKMNILIKVIQNCKIYDLTNPTNANLAKDIESINCEICRERIVDSLYQQLIWQTHCKHCFHHECIMVHLGDQIEVYIKELKKRRKVHPNDTLSLISKEISNVD